MAVVKRTRDGVDILEHLMQGVRNSESRVEIRGFHGEGTTPGVSAGSEVYTADDTPVEREVIVRLPARRKRR